MDLDISHFVPRAEFTQVMALLWVVVITAIVLVTRHLNLQRKHKRLEMIHQERMLAMEKGIPLPELPEFPEQNKRAPMPVAVWGPQNPRWPLGVGVIFIMLGLGISVSYALAGDAQLASHVGVANVWPFGLIGVFVGVGFILHYFLTRPPA